MFDNVKKTTSFINKNFSLYLKLLKKGDGLLGSRKLDIVVVVLAGILILTSFLPYPGVYGGVKGGFENFLTGFAGDSGQVNLQLTQKATNVSAYKNRVFYEDGSKISLIVLADGVANLLKANFSCMDSAYSTSAETVTALGNNQTHFNYSVEYTISLGNSVTNWQNNDDSSCPVGEDCHRICNVTLTSDVLNQTIQLPLYNGDPDSSDAWYVGYVTRASNCAAGAPGSNYFLEDNTCSSVFYNTADQSYYYGAKDVDFSIKKKNTPDVIESSCTDSEDNDGDGKVDCDDADCASIVYGEYYIVGGSNENKGYTPGWICNKTQLGWRDDPPIGAGDLASVTCVGGGACDDLCASNLCTGSSEDTTVTFARRIKPGANMSVRLEQNSGVSGTTVYFKVWQFNSSLWQNAAGDFIVINESSSTGFNGDGMGQTSTSLIVQSGDFPGDPIAFTNSQLDVVMKAKMDITNDYRNLYGLVLNRIFDGSSSNFKFNINITDEGVDQEHDISCADSYDNDLDYSSDCLDADCDTYAGSTTPNPDSTYPICEYQTESTYAASNNTCIDNFDNDADGDTDCHWSSGTWDTDCNTTNIINASWDTLTNIGNATGICQLGTETTCTDDFDNDRDRAYDCATEQVESYANIQYSTSPAFPKQTYTGGNPSSSANRPDGEYDCGVYCRANGYANETSNLCYDGKDNDLDYYGSGGMDCRMINYDTGCNQSNNGTFTCELIYETSCIDGYDNDRDGEYDCVTASTGGATTNPTYQFSTSGSNTATGEYDCQATCNVTANWEDNSTLCSDNKDNDLDYWSITGWSGTQYTATNNQYDGGMDCRFNYDGNHYPDDDCDGVNMTALNQTCELGYERNCTDNYDNDQDASHNDGGNFTAAGGYDCDDYDCHGNAACPVTETGTVCLDGYDNDLDRYNDNRTAYLLDSNRVENSSGGVDCIYYANGYKPNQNWPYGVAYDNYQYDVDCNNTAISGSLKCELINELNCSDSYDNDQDYYISQIQNVGWDSAVYNEYFGSGTYAVDADCDDYSCSGNSDCPTNESMDVCKLGECNASRNWCLDGFDNDLDKYLSDGFTLNTADGAGIDCAWSGYDTDCNNTYINDSGAMGFCQLEWELNCTDGADNDQDLGEHEVDAGGNNGTDCDDYNCYAVMESGDYVCTEDPTGGSIVEATCNDTLDNDLDGYNWNGTAYVENSSTGIDCADPDCNGVPGPGGLLCALSEEMEFDPFSDTVCGDYNVTLYAADNDNDGPANCYDTGCYHQGLCRICPETENVTIDSCMDNLNNEYVYQNADMATLLYATANTNASLDDNAVDCADSDCNGYVGLYGGNQGICNASAGSNFISETACTDGYDNDFDNSVDCEDSDCSADASCAAPYTNSRAACGSKCTDAGNVAYLSNQPPKTSSNNNWGGGTPDLAYTQYQHRAKNLTFRFTDTAGNVNGKTLAIYLGSASATYMPNEFNISSVNSGIYGTDVGNFNVQYSAAEGGYYRAVLIEYDGAYPNQALDITFWVQVPDGDGIVTNSSYSFYVSDNVGGTEKSGTVTQYILETEQPSTPVFVKTTPANDVHTTNRLRLIKSDNNVTRLTSSDTVTVRVNATDNSGTWNSGVELCQFNFGSGWINESSAYDCSQATSIADGSHLIYARVVDGVGNVGSSTSLNITVTTIPKQSSAFYCPSGNCSAAYPTKDYYNTSESMVVSVNFTSDYDFDANTTGCMVYAENQNSGSRVLLGNIARSTNGNCNGSVSLTGRTEGYYTIKVSTIDSNGKTAVSGDDPWANGQDKENIWVCDYIQTAGGYTCKDECEQVAGDTPDAPTLHLPPDNNETTNRTPQFQWYNSTGGSGAQTYEIQIDDSSIFSSINYNANGISEGTGSISGETIHVPTSNLGVDTTYYWRVRAYSGLVSSEWSDVWNFTIDSLRRIVLIRDSVSFGTMEALVTNDTIDNAPLPFLIENDGNIFVNLSINATNLWESQSNPSDYYQFAAGVNESGSFNTGTSTTTFTQMPITQTEFLINLNWSFASDTAELDINITPPQADGGGIRNSTVLVETT